MDWKRLSWVDWFLGVGAAVGFFVYGIVCIVTRQGVFMIPFHKLGQGSSADSMNVSGLAAVRTGVAYLIWAAFCHMAGIWKASRRLDEDTWGKLSMALFAASVVALLWAMAAM